MKRYSFLFLSFLQTCLMLPIANAQSVDSIFFACNKLERPDKLTSTSQMGKFDIPSKLTIKLHFTGELAEDQKIYYSLIGQSKVVKYGSSELDVDGGSDYLENNIIKNSGILGKESEIVIPLGTLKLTTNGFIHSCKSDGNCDKAKWHVNQDDVMDLTIGGLRFRDNVSVSTKFHIEIKSNNISLIGHVYDPPGYYGIGDVDYYLNDAPQSQSWSQIKVSAPVLLSFKTWLDTTSLKHSLCGLYTPNPGYSSINMSMTGVPQLNYNLEATIPYDIGSYKSYKNNAKTIQHKVMFQGTSISETN